MMKKKLFNASNDIIVISDLVENNTVHKKLDNGMTIHAGYIKTDDKKISITVEVFSGKQSIAREGFVTPYKRGSRKALFISIANNLANRVLKDIAKFERKYQELNVAV